MDKYFFGGIGALILVTLLVAAVTSPELSSPLEKEKAAVIQLNGPITASQTSSFQTNAITPEKVRELNERAKTQNAGAIIYEWNSGGGAVVASKEVKREIDSVEMPTVCRFRDVAASGAYLASLGCDRIVADSASITGSIGVKSSYMEYSGLMRELGIEYVNITSGRYKDVGSPFQNITDEEREILQEKTDIIHRDFVSSVVEERNLTENQTAKVRTGEIFLGTEAKKLGLVDSLGGRATAVNEAENMTETELQTTTLETQPKFNILSLLSANTWIGNSLNNQVPLKATWR